MAGWLGMSYAEEFKRIVAQGQLGPVLRLWEEYVSGSEVDGDELLDILETLRVSPLAQSFGKYAESALTQWIQLDEASEHSYLVLRAIVDLQTSNGAELADIVTDVLKKRYGELPLFSEKLRLVGLRKRDNFQGALRRFELLNHMAPGRFVFHSGGWGVGRIVDVSMVREQMSVEFENVTGNRELSFANAFKTLIPVSDDHFLARRFAQPDALEEEAMRDPVGVITMLLRDLGPQTAAQIKDEMCDLVIPEEQWAKWWQGARARLKKEPKISFPRTMSEPFKLRLAELNYRTQFEESLEAAKTTRDVVELACATSRDLPALMRQGEVRQLLRQRLQRVLEEPTMPSELMEIRLVLADLFPQEEEPKLRELVTSLNKPEQMVESVEPAVLKKRLLQEIREARSDWIAIYINLLQQVSQSHLRDAILKELRQPEAADQLRKRIEKLLDHPAAHPGLFVWYFQQLMEEDNGDLPFSDDKGRWKFFEGLFVLYHALENVSEQRTLLKKVYGIISAKRFELVRRLLQGTTLEEGREFTLLVSKCHTLGDHDIQILHSLARVVHPQLGAKRTDEMDEEVLWTSAESYQRMRQKLEHLSTVEVAANARDIETARAHGDLRENSEYKYALERRRHLQAEMQMLSEQLKRARILSPQDVPSGEIGIGSEVEVADGKGNRTRYILLGPWDADPSRNIISNQSKLARAMQGHRVGDTISFQGEEMTVIGLKRAV
jgi:transcription elongation factor GreA-like protein/transcription elongation GreA/GreB family factor